jgi:hypothetical protein
VKDGLENRMSNTAALALIVASFFAGFVGYIYATKFAHHVATEIVTGTARSAPLPTNWRWSLLYGRYLYVWLSVVGWTLGIAAVNVKIGSLTNDAGVKVVAHIVVALNVLVAVGWSAYGTIELLHLRSMLRGSGGNTK